MAETLESYLARLCADLETTCGKRQAGVILAEAEAHLKESIEDLARRGMTVEAAEAAAMARFGDAASVCTWFAEVHRRPSVWRASRWPIAALALYYAQWHFGYLVAPIYMVTVSWAFGVVHWSAFALLVYVCYRSKRFTFGVQALAIALFFIGQFVVFARLYVTIPADRGYALVTRADARREIAQAPAKRAEAEGRIALMEEGQRWFSSKSAPMDLPAVYRDSRGFRTPNYFEGLSGRSFTYVDGKLVDGVFEDYALARQFWGGLPESAILPSPKHGPREPFYIGKLRDDIEKENRISSKGPALIAQPWTKNSSQYLLPMRYQLPYVLIVALFADSAAALLRRRVGPGRRRRLGIAGA